MPFLPAAACWSHTTGSYVVRGDRNGYPEGHPDIWQTVGLGQKARVAASLAEVRGQGIFVAAPNRAPNGPEDQNGNTKLGDLSAAMEGYTGKLLLAACVSVLLCGKTTTARVSSGEPSVSAPCLSFLDAVPCVSSTMTIASVWLLLHVTSPLFVDCL